MGLHTCRDSWEGKLAREAEAKLPLKRSNLLYTRNDCRRKGCTALSLGLTSNCSWRIIEGHLDQSTTVTETCFLCQLP